MPNVFLPMLFPVRKGGHFRDVTIGEYFFSSFNFNYEIMACVLKNYFRNRLCTLFYLAYDIGLDFTYQLRRLYQSMEALRRHTLPYPYCWIGFFVFWVVSITCWIKFCMIAEVLCFFRSSTIWYCGNILIKVLPVVYVCLPWPNTR